MENSKKNFDGFIGLSTFCKFLFNVAKRLLYPFAPEIARGLNTELLNITFIIGLNNATTLLGPLGAIFGDKYGYKLLLLFSLGFLAIGTFVAGLIPVYSVFVISLFISGLGKTIFDPSIQALVSNIVPFEKRGKIIGITEISWAGSTLIGIPFMSIIIVKFSWQTPFLIIGGLCLICFFIMLLIMPNDKTNIKTKTCESSLIENWKLIVKNPKVFFTLLFVFFIFAGNDNLFVVYGAWLEESYGLSIASIGFGTILIGSSELLGESCTLFFSDKIGLKKSVIIGALVCSFTYFFLLLLNTSLWLFLLGIFLVFFAFEFTVVSSMSFSTELMPEIRALIMSSFFATAGFGRVAGALCGGIVWSKFGSYPICIISGVCNCIALLLFLAGFYFQKRLKLVKH